MVNVIAKIPGSSPDVVILAGHYDTKRMRRPFVGANDGGSSAAFLLEMARVLSHRQNKVTYWLVFFDGEESVERWSAEDGFYGSRHLAQKLQSEGRLSQIRALLLVDMIADAFLDIRPESDSTPWLNTLVFEEAHHLGYGEHFLTEPKLMHDDHDPFLERKVPAIDIIDFDYGAFNRYWHTPEDTLDKCSPESLGIVGSVIIASLASLEDQTPPKGLPF